MIVNGQPKTTITNVRSLELTFQTEILTENYLGKTTSDKDSIYNGISGRLEFHPDNQDILKVITEFVDKARRRTPGVQINIKATLNFPNGQRPRILVPNCEFGPAPLSAAGRSDYVSVSFDFEASEHSFLF